jgi:hypothetical protein
MTRADIAATVADYAKLPPTRGARDSTACNCRPDFLT